MVVPLPISQDSGAGFLPTTQTPDHQVGKLARFAFKMEPLIPRKNEVDPFLGDRA